MASISKPVVSMYSLFLVICLTSVIKGQSGFVQPTGLSSANTASQFSTASNIIPNSNAFVQSANTFYPGDVHSAK
ncbi:hypothetical protein MAR_008220, partial [Mya arenaria]